MNHLKKNSFPKEIDSKIENKYASPSFFNKPLFKQFSEKYSILETAIHEICQYNITL